MKTEEESFKNGEMLIAPKCGQNTLKRILILEILSIIIFYYKTHKIDFFPKKAPSMKEDK